MIKYALVALSLLVLALGISHYRTNETVNHLKSTLQEYEILKDSIISFTEKEFEEYLNLKSQEEKFKKADELFGKVMLLFLGQLGIKIADEKQSKLNDMAMAISIGETPELEVITDPYGDLEKQCDPCPTCPMCSNTSQNKDQSLISMENKIKKYNKVHQKKAFRGLDLKDRLKPISYMSHLKFYEGNYHGSFFIVNADEYLYTSLSLAFVSPKKQSDKIKSNVIIDGRSKSKRSTYILEREFLAYHPHNHRDDPGGTCHKVILESDNLTLVLSRNKFSNLWGKLYERENKKSKNYKLLGSIDLRPIQNKEGSHERF